MIYKYIKNIYQYFRRRAATFLGYLTCDMGKDVKVNRFSKFTRKTIVGDHSNFNGMRIVGNGNVKIGRYFHSGEECLMITSNHNYDCGDAIPDYAIAGGAPAKVFRYRDKKHFDSLMNKKQFH